MSNLYGKRILIFQQRGWAINIGHFLARKLQEEGCRLAAFTLKRTTHNFILNQKEVKYDFIINNDEIMNKPIDYLNGDDYSLGQICEELGVKSIWPLVMSLRNHVRSYKDKYYYGFKQNVPDEEIVHYVKAAFKCIKFFFEKFGPDLIITPNFVSLPHIMFNLYAKKQGIKMIAVLDSKVNEFFVFSYDYQNSEAPFIDCVDKLNARLVSTENRQRAKDYIREFRQKFIEAECMIKVRAREKKMTLLKKIRYELSPYRAILRWYLRKQINVLESTGITLDYRPPRIILRDHYCQKRYKKFADNFKYYPFEKLNKFVYFPLQVQPEMTIDVVAPFFSNQIETARQVAMCLPGDYILAAKEHPAMVGLRPCSYLEKIDRTPNIKLIDYRISSSDILKKMDLIVSPNSTSLYEAAFYYKPAIQLGNLGTTLRLPNVFKHTDMTTLAEKIGEVLKIDLKTEEYERRLENFIAAVYDAGFNFKYEVVWEKGRGDKMENLWNIYRKEIKNCFSTVNKK